jgi:tetratricopeptide (TPR) repeat protein
MNRPLTRILILVLLGAGSFSIATVLQPRAVQWSRRGNSDSALEVLLGDGRRMFANHFFVKADVSFHSGYYPSVFDQVQAPTDSRHMTEEESGHHDAEEEAHERQMSFLGPPRDCFERFGRNFIVTQHSHLEGGNEREILPWLRLSAELDPQRVDTYTVAAFWLRKRLGKAREAEQFLREGLRANPNSFQILFELGRLYHEDFHDETRARNVWELALQRWREQEGNKKEPDLLAREEIAINLARLEETQGDFASAIGHLELAKTSSPASANLQQQIDDLRKKESMREGSGHAP